MFTPDNKKRNGQPSLRRENQTIFTISNYYFGYCTRLLENKTRYKLIKLELLQLEQKRSVRARDAKQASYRPRNSERATLRKREMAFYANLS